MKKFVLTAKEQKVKDILLKKYVFMEKSIDLLFIGYKTNTNLVLYGKGGHGKSDLTMDFYTEMGIKPFVLTMGSGMNGDRLLGGINIPLLNKEGKIEYLCDNSWMNHEYVIFEEMMDAPDFILEQLKDIISAGTYRNGSQQYDIKTKMILCNTNRLRKDFAKNDSLMALMERFPLEHQVAWKDYNRVTYTTLLDRVCGATDPMLAHIMGSLADKDDHIISPRIAIKAQQLIDGVGIEALDYLADFKAKKASVAAYVKSFKTMFEYHNLKAELDEQVKVLNEISKKCETAFDTAYFEKLKPFEKLQKKFAKLKPQEDDVESWKKDCDTYSELYDTVKYKIKAGESLAKSLGE